MEEQQQQQDGVHPVIRRCCMQAASRQQLQQQGKMMTRRNHGQTTDHHQCKFIFRLGDSNSRLRVNRQSVQYIVDFLQGRREGEQESSTHNHHVPVTELHLYGFRFSGDDDGVVDILCDFLAHNNTSNDTKLARVELRDCDFGSAENTARLLTAFRSHTSSVTDLKVYKMSNLQMATFADCVSDILEHDSTSRLMKLDFSHCVLRGGPLHTIGAFV
jgi:hypothetical protein